MRKPFKVRYTTNKDWDPAIPVSPQMLFAHPQGANRRQRRMSRERSQKLAHETPPGSMVPAIKRLEKKTILDHDGRAIKVPTGKVEYVAAK